MFVTDFGYSHIVPMNSKKYVHHAMKNFFKNVGVLPDIISDFSGKQVQGEAQRICEQVGSYILHLEKRMTWDNCAE